MSSKSKKGGEGTGGARGSGGGGGTMGGPPGSGSAATATAAPSASTAATSTPTQKMATTSDGRPIIVQTVDLAKRYKRGRIAVAALDGVTITIARGEIIGIVRAIWLGEDDPPEPYRWPGQAYPRQGRRQRGQPGRAW